MSSEHFIHHGTQTPKVNSLIALFTGHNLGSHVLRDSRHGEARNLILLEFLAEPEVSELHVAKGINEYIFRFEIPVNHSIFVQVVERQDNLGNIELTSVLTRCYCYSVSFSLMSKRLYNYPPAQCSKTKYIFLSDWNVEMILIMKGCEN